MNFRDLLVVLLWLLSACGIRAATVSIPDYTAPGYLSARISSGRFVKARASFVYIFSAAGTRSLSSTWRLLDDQGNPVGIYLDGQPAASDPSVTATTTVAAVNNLLSAYTVEANIVPYAPLDPSRIYRFELVSIYDATAAFPARPTNLSQSGVQAPGNTYVHFSSTNVAALQVVAKISGAAYAQRFRVQTASSASSDSGFTVTPTIDLYRFDEAVAAAANINLRFTVTMQDDLGNAVALATSVFDRTVSGVQPYSLSGGFPFFAYIPNVQTGLAVASLTIKPSGQLDPVNRSYTATVKVAFEDMAGIYTSVLNGSSTALSRLVDFNGRLNFGSIATTFTDVTNDPASAAGAVAGGRLPTTLTVAAASGTIDAAGSAHTFGGGAALPVGVDASGAAYFTGGGSVPVTGPATDSDTLNSINFTRQSMSLTSAGLKAGTLVVSLPPGVGYTASVATKRFAATLSQSAVSLDQSLNPSGVVSFTGGRLTEESKPLEFAVSGIDWTGAAGTFSATVTGVTPVRKASVDALFANRLKLADVSSATKAANDHVYLGVSAVAGGAITIGLDANKNGTLTARLVLGAAKFYPHLPCADVTDSNQDISYVNGSVDIVADNVLPASSSLGGVAAFDIPHNRACADKPDATPLCGAAPDKARVRFTPAGGVLRLTRDGGLQGDGATDDAIGGGDFKLKWGQDPTDIAKYAHIVNTLFRGGSYLMAGSSLVGGIKGTGSTAPGVSTSAWMGAGSLLYSGVDRAAVAADNVLRPGTLSYLESDAQIADYPGVNFRVSDLGAAAATSRIAGTDTPAYNLTLRSQYYARNAGVSGVHEAQSFNESLLLYGYPVAFTAFKFSYLDNFNEDSLTSASITLPAPSGFTIAFEKLSLPCPGGLSDAKIDSAAGLELQYWDDAPITPLSFRFESSGGCDPAGPALLVLGVEAACELFEDKLGGELGFRPNGQIAARADGGPVPFDSRLKVPSVGLPGPGNKTYPFTPCQDAYFNSQNKAGAPAVGFLNLAGSVDVPFFQDLKWNVHTKGKYVPGLPPSLYAVAAGWVDGTETFFNSVFFDPGNAGFAGGNAEGYRQSSADGQEPYAVEAEQDWLGITDAFHYSLRWSEGGRAFSSDDVTKDFFVASLTHRAKYLCPDTAELTFGLEYDGLPQLNIAGLATSALDAGVGYTQNMIDALGATATDQLLGGIDAGKDLLSNELEKLIAPVIDGPVMTAVDQLLDDLYGLPGSASVQITSANAAAALTNRVRNAGGDVRQGIDDAFASTGVGTATALADEKLAAVQGGVGTLVADPNGLLRTAGVKKMVSSLVAREAPQFISLIAGELAGAALDDVINSPALEQVRGSLVDVNVIITEMRTRITDPTTGMAAQLQAAVASEIATLTDSIADSIEDELGHYAVGVNIDLREVPRVQLRAYIRQEIIDNLIESQILGVLQTQLRQYAQDAVGAVTNQLDNGLQLVNGVLRDVIATRLAEVDESINGEILGPMSDMIGSGRLNGYAHIEGDSLSMLRVDGLFRLKVPDDLELKAYLQIRKLTSDNAGGCIPAGATANEILIGAEKVPLKWISPDLTASLGVKFTLMGGEPVGLGGFFDMTGGPLSFEAFKINDMNAAVAFGAIDGDPFKAENYLAASADLTIGEYGMAGGVFFGRSCSLDPIALIDPEVAGVLGVPPFTGAYLYGEARLPINELIGIPSTCMLNVVVGAGAGVFVFTEGPTIGGKLVGEVSGEALCLVSIGGRMSLVGVKEGFDLTSPMRFAGKGTLKGKVGACPFCVKFNKSVGVKFSASHGKISAPEVSY